MCGCAVESDRIGFAELDRVRFDCRVQPVLAAQCATPACHGDAERRMQVLAPGRMRMTAELIAASEKQPHDDATSGLHPPLTERELRFNFAQARSMVRVTGHIADSPLLMYPLAMGAGGHYHEPKGEVFPSRDDPDYVALYDWAAGATGCP